MSPERAGIGMSQKIIFIGNYTDEATYQIITQHEIRDLSQAARLFQQRLINSLEEQSDNFRAISVLPTDNRIHLPETIKEKRTKIEVVSIENGSAGSMLHAMKRIRDIVKKCGRDTCVLMYAVNPIALVPLLMIRKEYALTLVTVCPELPKYRRYKKTIRNDIKRIIFNFFNYQFDRYIVFAEAMQEYLPKGKPTLLLEGFAPDVIQTPTVRDKNIALYAGGLAEDNGIRLMIEAAHISKDIDELWICGVGESLEYVKDSVDSKIKYLGRRTNEEVLEFEKQAKVLLNVRNPDNNLTRFSFPSKVLEYMAAGGIVISSKLEGIPSEYFQYLGTLDDYSTIGLAAEMDKVFEMTDTEFLQKTRAANNFVKTKDAQQRAKEIIEFISRGRVNED